MNRQQSGFTLIELVMVIVILGILAATALPKFADLTGDAEIAAANGARGAVSSAAAIGHATWLINSAAPPATIEGTPVAWVNQYPDSATIAAVAGVSANDFTLAAAAGVATVTSGAAAGGACFTYTEAAAGAAPVISAVGVAGVDC